MAHRTLGLLTTLALATLLVPAVAHAQRPANVPRIGMLLGNDPDAAAPSLEAFRQALRTLGYVEGQTIALDSFCRKNYLGQRKKSGFSVA